MYRPRRKKNPKPVTLRTRKLYAKLKAELFDLIGRVCVHCGSTKNLTADHKDGHRDWEPDQVHGTKRMRIYILEAKDGQIQASCKACNSSKWDSPEEDDTF